MALGQRSWRSLRARPALRLERNGRRQSALPGPVAIREVGGKVRDHSQIMPHCEGNRHTEGVVVAPRLGRQ
jgi:hypothetical protein